MRATPDAPIDRDTAVDAIVAAGVGAGVYYPKVVFDYDCYRNHPGVVADPVPVAEQIASEVFSLPVHQHLSGSDVDQIIVTVRSVFER